MVYFTYITINNSKPNVSKYAIHGAFWDHESFYPSTVDVVVRYINNPEHERLEPKNVGIWKNNFLYKP